VLGSVATPLSAANSPRHEPAEREASAPASAC
jgi:hypothetical protein